MPQSMQWASAREIQAHIVAGHTSASAVIQACLTRIERLNPTLNAFTHIDREGAMSAARQADAAHAEGHEPGPLHGVPVAIKDDLWVADMPSACGSLLFADFRPSIDGTVAARLRAAGAIIVGKTTMPEFAAWPRSKSYVGGEAVNPWDTRRIPGASSGGSATAVAAGMVPLAIGTDGGGSTRIPAALTGLVGLHSTLGRVPGYGSFRCSPCESAGPLARNVADAALVQQIIAGPDPRDENALTEAAPDVLATLEETVAGLSIGWSADFGWIPVAPAVAGAARRAVSRLAEQGVAVRDITRRIDHPWGDGSLMAALHAAVAKAGDPPRPDTGSPARRPDLDGVEAWLERGSAKGELCFVAHEFIALGRRHSDLLSPPQQCLGSVTMEGAGIPSPQELDALMDELFAAHDLICSPTMATVAPIAPPGWASAYGDSYMGTHFTFIANATSCPAVSVPCGLVDGLPVGLQILGRRGDEATVLRMARAVEKALPPLPGTPPMP